MVDEGNLIDYMLTVFYTGNFDAPVTRFRKDKGPNNFYAIYNRNGTGGWKFIMHDAEHSLFGLEENRTGPFPIQPEFKYFNPGYLHQKLPAHPEYRMKFIDRVYKHFYNNGVFVPENTERLMKKRIREVETAMIAEAARWGDAQGRTNTPRDWRQEIDYLLNPTSRHGGTSSSGS